MEKDFSPEATNEKEFLEALKRLEKEVLEEELERAKDPIKEALSEIFRPHTGGIKLYDIKNGQNGRAVRCQDVEKLYDLVYKEIEEANILNFLNQISPTLIYSANADKLISRGIITEKEWQYYNETVRDLIYWRKKIEWRYEQNKDRFLKKSGRSLVARLVDLFDHYSKMSKDVALYSAAHILKHLDMESGCVEDIFKRIKGDYYRKKEPLETDHI